MGLLSVLSFFVFMQVAFAASIPGHSTANADFTSDFFNRIAKGKHDENVVVSPVSVQTCLAMLFIGAKGKTADEMVTGLHFTTSDKTVITENAKTFSESLSPMIKIANRIYVHKTFSVKPTFNEVVKQSFKAEAENLDFEKTDESAKTINTWVEDNTNGKIKDLVSESTVENALMILVNAIHFKGQWENPFSWTEKETFWNSESDKVIVDMMHQTEDFKHGSCDELELSGIEMPYANSKLSMMILLPTERTGLKNIETKLKNIDLMEISSRMEKKSVRLQIPKFEFEFDVSLNSVLSDMGMKTMFTDKADFSDLMNSGAQVSDVVHKAFINVNENGSEAAAATFVKMSVTSAVYPPPPPPIDFIANHPFIFVIKDDTTIYFVGHVAFAI